jgi:hypothetical protein
VKVFSRHKNVYGHTSYTEPGYTVNFSFVINNLEEFYYTRNIYNVYNFFILPFINENRRKFSKYSNWFQRIFYINGFNQTDGTKFGKYRYVGKSFVNTKNVDFMVNPHLPDGDWMDVYENFVSHFRKRYILGNHERSILFFGIDLNYFVCYVKPFINSHF